MDVVRIAPFHYIHVLDQKTHVISLHKGPLAYVLQNSEVLQSRPKEMVTIGPMCYAAVENPVKRNKRGDAQRNKQGQYELRHGDTDIRTHETHPEPFVLYPGEDLSTTPRLRQYVRQDYGVLCVALRDFEDKKAGDQWIAHGPATLTPRIEVQVVKEVAPYLITDNSALKLRATIGFTDRKGIKRPAGAEWLERQRGSYLPDAYEEVLMVVNAEPITQLQALSLRCVNGGYVDVYGKARKPGHTWLVTKDMASKHIPDVNEEILGKVDITVLGESEFCVIEFMGNVRQVIGPKTFFLQPDEVCPRGVQRIYLLNTDDSLLLSASEGFQDGSTKRTAGERWMVHGPCEYVPPVEVEILEKRRAVALDVNEGIYVRNIDTGKVRSVLGAQKYVLKPNEELWEKELTADAEILLARQAFGFAYVPTAATASKKELDRYSSVVVDRVKSEVITFCVPTKTAVQIYQYDYFSKKAKSRVVFGPELVMLEPDEEFTVSELSGDRPKRPEVIKTISLALGPDYMTDDVDVVTSDHAKLRLCLAYNWHFDLTQTGEKDDYSRLFSVKDFIGDVCKTVAADVRGHVATLAFAKFHQKSVSEVRKSAMGVTNGKINRVKRFSANGLIVTNVDIKSIEPVDEKTKQMLSKSVQLAIEITTQKSEADARHEAERLEEKARSVFEQQKLSDEKKCESQRKKLLELENESNAVENAGQAKSEAEALARAKKIEAISHIEMAEKKAEASSLTTNTELEIRRSNMTHELRTREEKDALELAKRERLAEIDNSKLQKTMDAIGRDTLVSMSSAKMMQQAKLLRAVNMKGMLISDGSNPVDLLEMAQGFVGGECA